MLSFSSKDNLIKPSETPNIVDCNKHWCHWQLRHVLDLSNTSTASFCFSASKVGSHCVSIFCCNRLIMQHQNVIRQEYHPTWSRSQCQNGSTGLQLGFLQQKVLRVRNLLGCPASQLVSQKLHPVFKANQRLWQTQGVLPTEKPECLDYLWQKVFQIGTTTFPFTLQPQIILKHLQFQGWTFFGSSTAIQYFLAGSLSDNL
jgi:hypothetical protein